jgi:hypothetical protein
MKLLERDIGDTKQLIRATKKDMREMIEQKDVFYKQVRDMRKKDTDET